MRRIRIRLRRANLSLDVVELGGSRVDLALKRLKLLLRGGGRGLSLSESPARALGLALQARGRLDEAVAEYRKAVAVDPKLYPAWSNLGAALLDQRKPDEAITALREALRLEPGHPGHARDHNHLGFSVWLAGAGLKKGIAYGATLWSGAMAASTRFAGTDGRDRGPRVEPWWRS